MAKNVTWIKKLAKHKLEESCGLITTFEGVVKSSVKPPHFCSILSLNGNYEGGLMFFCRRLYNRAGKQNIENAPNHWR